MSWEEVNLKELVTLKQGFAVNSKSKHYICEDGTGLPLLKISDLFNNTETLFVKKEIPKQFLVHKNEIIYSRTGNSLGYAFIGREGVIYNNCFKVIPNEEKINKIFLYKILNTNTFRIYAQTLATGTAQPDLNHDAFKSIKIKLPSLEIQQKIVNLISKYDNLVENNYKRIKLLENMAEEIYKEWFVRLRFPNYQNTKILDGIPEGWGKEKLEKHIEFEKGKKSTEISSTYKKGLLKLLSLESLDTKEYLYGDKRNQVIAKENDLLMVMDGARSSIVFFADEGIVGSTLSLVKSCSLSSSYLYYFFKFNYMILEVNNTGSAIPHANKRFINRMDIFIPNGEVLKKWDLTVSNIIKEIKVLQEKNQNLKQTRDLLLPRLISGKLDIEDLDIQ